MFQRCDADAVARFISVDFVFDHDQHGRIGAFSMRRGREHPLRLSRPSRRLNIKAARQRDVDQVEVLALAQDGASQIARHRFFEVRAEARLPPREQERFFLVWRKVEGR